MAAVNTSCGAGLQSLITSLSKVELERVSVVRKLLYAVGTLPYALTLNLIGFYFTVFLLDVALVSQIIDIKMVTDLQYYLNSLRNAPINIKPHHFPPGQGWGI